MPLAVDKKVTYSFRWNENVGVLCTYKVHRIWTERQPKTLKCTSKRLKWYVTHCYSIVSFHPWQSNRLALPPTYMLGLVFIRSSGTVCALALQYWQRSAAHSTSGGANITNHLLLSDGSAPAPACLASNHSHLLPYLSFSLLSQKKKKKGRLGLSNIWLAQLRPGMCCLYVEHLFGIGTDQWPDVCWDMWSCRQMCESLVWTNSRAVEQRVGGWGSSLYLKGTNNWLFIHLVIYGWSFRFISLINATWFHCILCLYLMPQNTFSLYCRSNNHCH